MTTNTIKLHRVLKAPPERVYKAFLDPAAMCKWLSPNGFTCTVHHLDAKVGGTYKELKPGEKLRYSDRFDDPNLPGEMTTTVLLKKVSCGTEVSITQEGVPGVIPPEMCYLGWQESLDALVRLVEPEIPD